MFWNLLKSSQISTIQQCSSWFLENLLTHVRHDRKTKTHSSFEMLSVYITMSGLSCSPQILIKHRTTFISNCLYLLFQSEYCLRVVTVQRVDIFSKTRAKCMWPLSSFQQNCTLSGIVADDDVLSCFMSVFIYISCQCMQNKELFRICFEKYRVCNRAVVHCRKRSCWRFYVHMSNTFNMFCGYKCVWIFIYLLELIVLFRATFKRISISFWRITW